MGLIQVYPIFGFDVAFILFSHEAQNRTPSVKYRTHCALWPWLHSRKTGLRATNVPVTIHQIDMIEWREFISLHANTQLTRPIYIPLKIKT